MAKHLVGDVSDLDTQDKVSSFLGAYGADDSGGLESVVPEGPTANAEASAGTPVKGKIEGAN